MKERRAFFSFHSMDKIENEFSRRRICNCDLLFCSKQGDGDAFFRTLHNCRGNSAIHGGYTVSPMC